MNKILILDNRDSFSQNLRHLFLKDDRNQVDVIPTEDYTHELIDLYDAFVLSPGPGLPDDHNKLKQVILEARGIIPILGVCLGHQALAEVFGGKLFQLPVVMHGILSKIDILDRTGLMEYIDLAEPVGRYHSWMVSDENFPDCFVVTSRDAEGRIMSMRHKLWPIFGVQFHPESYMSKQGGLLARKFADVVEQYH